jgi:phosphatidylserine decarboxylase
MDPFSFLLWRFYYFFRDPIRTAPKGRVIVAPADGFVLYQKRVAAGEVPSPVKQGVTVPLDEWVGTVPRVTSGTLIGIYMSALNVHYIRSPVPGRVSKVVARPALRENLHQTRTFVRLLWNMQPYEAGSRYITENARNTIAIDGELPVVVVQIADRYVRHCDCYVGETEPVSAGQKIGMIRMGSQCDLFIPDRPNVKLDVQIGTQVKAGESVLGTY